MSEEGTARGKSEIVGEWVIRDKDGKVKERGIDRPTHEEGGGGEEEGNDKISE